MKQFNPDTTVVMITASEQDSDLFQALSLGANGYLMKDTAPDEMLARIRQALDGQVALNEHSVTLLAPDPTLALGSAEACVEGSAPASTASSRQ